MSDAPFQDFTLEEARKVAQTNMIDGVKSTSRVFMAEIDSLKAQLAQARERLVGAMEWVPIAEADLQDGEEIVALSRSGNWYETKYIHGSFTTIGGPALFEVTHILRITPPTNPGGA